MGRQNRTEYALLGLLAAGPKSGYDIKQEVEEVLSHFWHESYGHIYPVLKRLHDQDLATRRKEAQEGRPDRYVYTITDEGRRELRRWLAEPVEPRPPRNELLLKLFFGRFADPGTLASVVEEYGDQARTALERLETVAASLDADEELSADLAYWKMTLDMGLRTLAAIAAWVDDTVETLEAMEADS